MPEEEPKQENGTNWTMDGSFTPVITIDKKVVVIFSNHGVTITKELEDRIVTLLDMSYQEMADIVDRLESAEAEIGRLWAALQGKLEVELDEPV